MQGGLYQKKDPGKPEPFRELFKEVIASVVSELVMDVQFSA